MDQEVSTYIMAAAAGCIAGLIRFLKSPKQWRMRTVVASSLFGGMLSIITVGFWVGSDVIGKRWYVLAVALAIGFVQPEVIVTLGAIKTALMAGGINVSWLPDGDKKDGGKP